MGEKTEDKPLTQRDAMVILRDALVSAIDSLLKVAPLKDLSDQLALGAGIMNLRTAYKLIPGDGILFSEDINFQASLVVWLTDAATEINSALLNERFLRITRETKITAPAANHISNLRVEQMLRRALRVIDDVVGEPKAELLRIEYKLKELRSLLPTQKVSPVQFDIRDGKLAIIDHVAQAEAEDTENAQASRDWLVTKGAQLIEQLRSSNCDPRLVQNVDELQQALQRGENVIQLGLINIGVEEMGKAFAAELPAAQLGMLIGHTRGVAMYVAQFPEWQRFSEKAARVNLTENDIAEISAAATKLAADLERHPEIAEADVPKTIKALQQLIAHPNLATKRAAFAVLRTIENLIAKVFDHCADFLDKMAAKTVERLSTTASRVLVAVALASALSISPLGAKIAETAWVKTAAEIVQHYIELLTR